MMVPRMQCFASTFRRAPFKPHRTSILPSASSRRQLLTVESSSLLSFSSLVSSRTTGSSSSLHCQRHVHHQHGCVCSACHSKKALSFATCLPFRPYSTMTHLSHGSGCSCSTCGGPVFVNSSSQQGCSGCSSCRSSFSTSTILSHGTGCSCSTCRRSLMVPHGRSYSTMARSQHGTGCPCSTCRRRSAVPHTHKQGCSCSSCHTFSTASAALPQQQHGSECSCSACDGGGGRRCLSSLVVGTHGNTSGCSCSVCRMPALQGRRDGCALTSFRRYFSSDAAAGTVTVSIDEARAMTAKALQKIGWDDQDAALQAEIMTAAELCGNNQGLVKMYQPEMMAPTPNSGKPVVERDTPTSAVINAHQAPGMLAAVRAADLAVEKTNSKDINIAIVSSYNTSTSSGQLAFYAERMARKGVIAICMANSPEFVAAAQGGKRVFGTNPLAVGVPVAGSPYPFTFDMATSAIALFGVLSAKAKGEPLPSHVAYGPDGNWSTNAAEVLDAGAIATFGGHKGAGLSLCVELLAGALSGSAVLGQVPSKKDAKSWGHTMIAIRPDALVDDFPAKAASILAAVKASGDNIRIPGERSAKTAQERQLAESMPIPIKIWESIVHTAEHGLSK